MVGDHKRHGPSGVFILRLWPFYPPVVDDVEHKEPVDASAQRGSVMSCLVVSSLAALMSLPHLCDVEHNDWNDLKRLNVSRWILHTNEERCDLQSCVLMEKRKSLQDNLNSTVTDLSRVC